MNSAVGFKQLKNDLGTCDIEQEKRTRMKHKHLSSSDSYHCKAKSQFLL